MGTFQSTPTMWCHSVTEAGKLLAAKLGNPKKSPGEPAASVKQSHGRGSERLGQDGQWGWLSEDLKLIYQKHILVKLLKRKIKKKKQKNQLLINLEMH